MSVSGSSRARLGADSDGASAGSGGNSKRAVIAAVETSSRHRQRNESAPRGISLTMVLEDSEIERVLCITAHPDDVDFIAAGTIARWTASGIAVSYCIATSGDAGGFDPDVPRSEIAGIRQAEQRAAGAELG